MFNIRPGENKGNKRISIIRFIKLNDFFLFFTLMTIYFSEI